MWISADPAMGDYVPRAPVDDEAKKHNENLPGMGGVYNYVNMHVYHYAGNNPVKLIDPDGRDVYNNTIHAIVVRFESEDTQGYHTKLLAPGETYFGRIDGIMVQDGTTWKVSDTDIPLLGGKPINI